MPSYQAFRDALRDFESGWDRDRYNAGIIADWQLDSWAGGPVQSFYPQYGSWGDLTDAEWTAMSYRSMNSLGFVGYQFGEALLIDIGYYDDDFYYGNGAPSNTWDGTWTGKNGVTSLEDFMTGAAQEVAIQEAFGFNLKIIQDGLANAGLNLNDFIGTTTTYLENGSPVTVTLSLTGILAAAHLRGAYGTLSLLQNGAVSSDEYGTSILRYIDQFGGYDSPSVTDIIAYYETRLTGDEGIGPPGSPGTPGTPPGTPGNPGNGDANVDENTADVVITWAWGTDAVINNFNPATDTIFISWVSAASLDVTDGPGGVVFAIPSNNQTTTLSGVSLSDLGSSNFTILDDTAAEEVLGLIGDGAPANPPTPVDPPAPVDPPDPVDPPPPDPVDPPPPVDPPAPVDPPPPPAPIDPGPDDGIQQYNITWNWGAQEVISGFDTTLDVLDFGHLGAGQIAITEAAGDLVIEVLNNGGHTYRLDGVQAEDLTQDNLGAASYNSVLDASGGVIDQLTDLGFNDSLM